MRRRSSGIAALGLAALVGSWLFGSTPAAVIGIGFVVAGIAARLWASRVEGTVELERRLLPGERVEGADLAVEVRGRRRWGPFGGSVVLVQELGDLRQETRLRGEEATIVFERLHRGRHRLEPLRATLIDPLGLERVAQEWEEPVDVLIRPRIPVLTTAFSSRGARETGALRTAFRRPTGFEIHGVREYVPGEAIRSVHWPSTAHRGRLMVKELDDAPREDVVVVLDLDPVGVAGPPGASSFDAAVRVAGAIALSHVLQGRRAAIVGTAPTSVPVPVRTRGHDWEVALDALAAAEPVAGATVERALRLAASPLTRARELVVVTGRPGPAAEALLELRRTGSAVSIVAVAAETYAARPRAAADPALLRASARGVPVAVVSAGVPLEEALAPPAVRSIGA